MQGDQHPVRTKDLDQVKALDAARKIAYFLDGKRKRAIGWDPIIGMFPHLDTVTLIVSAYIPFVSWRLGLPKRKLVRMVLNILIRDLPFGVLPIPYVGVILDFFIGLIPDFFVKANRRNLAILEEHLAQLEDIEQKLDRPA
jgi:hypothetical protein